MILISCHWHERPNYRILTSSHFQTVTMIVKAIKLNSAANMQTTAAAVYWAESTAAYLSYFYIRAWFKLEVKIANTTFSRIKDRSAIARIRISIRSAKMWVFPSGVILLTTSSKSQPYMAIDSSNLVKLQKLPVSSWLLDLCRIRMMMIPSIIRKLIRLKAILRLEEKCQSLFK